MPIVSGSHSAVGYRVTFEPQQLSPAVTQDQEREQELKGQRASEARRGSGMRPKVGFTLRGGVNSRRWQVAGRRGEDERPAGHGEGDDHPQDRRDRDGARDGGDDGGRQEPGVGQRIERAGQPGEVAGRRDRLDLEHAGDHRDAQPGADHHVRGQPGPDRLRDDREDTGGNTDHEEEQAHGGYWWPLAFLPFILFVSLVIVDGAGPLALDEAGVVEADEVPKLVGEGVLQILDIAAVAFPRIGSKRGRL